MTLVFTIVSIVYRYIDLQYIRSMTCCRGTQLGTYILFRRTASETRQFDFSCLQNMMLENNLEKVRAIDMLFIHRYVWRMRLKYFQVLPKIPIYLLQFTYPSVSP